jgi:predicted GNAT family acetyltransferase
MASIFSLETQQEMKNEIIDSIMKTVSVLVQEKSQKRYLKFSEACVYASVSSGTLQKWVEKYGLSVSIIEGRKIVDTRDLDALIAKYKI